MVILKGTGQLSLTVPHQPESIPLATFSLPYFRQLMCFTIPTLDISPTQPPPWTIPDILVGEFFSGNMFTTH